MDHYSILGLPSGEEGAHLSDKDITKAYKAKALKLHPDKRRDDPNAQDNFLKLQASYNILKDEKARKLFDDLLRVKREQQRRRSEQEVRHDSKRRKMVSDLEERERAAAFSPDPDTASRHEEERIVRKLREEIARIRKMHAKEGMGASMPSVGKEQVAGEGSGLGVLDKEKVLKVSWEKMGPDYSAERLKEVFSEFGKVEDVVIKSSKKKGSALVVMESKDAVVSLSYLIIHFIFLPFYNWLVG